ncbi:hypothetical protein ACNPQK_01605 [Acinetobacter guillouiae]|uniref:hypothetical protein n=1 Tax=Acinetobacter guillouiae TaxID=106649 RepID=UPI003AF6EB40
MNKNFTNILLLIITITGVIYVSIDILASENLYRISMMYDFTPLFIVLGFGISLIFIIRFMSNFLNNEHAESIFSNIINGVANIINVLTSLTSTPLVEKEISSKVNIQIDESEVARAVDLIKDKIEKTSNEFYFSDLKENLRSQVLIENFQHKISSIESRVKGEIERLSKSAIMNLSLGMMLSIGGISYLGFFILDAKDFEDLEHMFMSIFPRSVFVLLIEVFAYFFLKLYKQNLDDIKYYQNELTNIESKNLAVQISKQSNNHKLITLCIEEFLKTERNFILEKDQSTIDLEKERISSNNSNNTLQAIKDIFVSKNNK